MLFLKCAHENIALVCWQAAILQQTAEYIYQLEQEKTRLLSQNCQLKRVINVHEGETSSSAPKKRKVEVGKDAHANDDVAAPQEPAKYKIVISSSGVVCVNESSADEGIGSMSPEPLDGEQSPESLRKEMIELRMQLDRERRLRLQLEDQVRSLEAQLYPERIREITQQVQLQYQQILPDVSYNHFAIFMLLLNFKFRKFILLRNLLTIILI